MKTSETLQRGFLAISAGCIAAFVSSPADLLRTRQAGFTGSYISTPSMSALCQQLVRESGMRGLFSGTSALLARAASFNVAQLLTYDVCKSKAMKTFQLDGSHVGGHVVAALGAGFVATTVSTPFENIKTCMQLEKSGEMRTVARRMWTKGGSGSSGSSIRLFFRGFVPMYLRCGSHTLVVFVVAEKIRSFCGMTPM